MRFGELRGKQRCLIVEDPETSSLLWLLLKLALVLVACVLERWLLVPLLRLWLLLVLLELLV